MMKKLTKHSTLFGLIFTIAAAIFIIAFSSPFFTEERLLAYQWNIGIDSLGGLICAALFYGCMKQESDGVKYFRRLIVWLCASFVVNEMIYFTVLAPEYRTLFFVFCLLSKLIDLAMIFLFYLYVKVTLGFEGKLAEIAIRVIPILLIVQTLVLLANIITPITFTVTANGMYQDTAISLLEDIFLAVTAVLTTILIFKSQNHFRQKTAALTFIFLPILEYAMLGATFAEAAQYGVILTSLIIMYCVIFNAKSTKLAATQTELNMATEIQASMLPSIFPAFPERPEFDLYASMDPAKEVGGDFYDFFMIDDDHLGTVIADVSGKGVPAALFMMISKTVVQNYAMMGLGAAEVLRRANEALCAQNKMQMFVTTWIGILELSTGKMTCASAGHEYPAICHDGQFALLKDKHGFVLAGMEGAKYRDYEIQFIPGDKLFVYTDGVPEATNANKELFGTDRMIEALNTATKASPKEILQTVRASVDEFVGAAEQFDDLTMVCLEYRGRKS